MCDDLDTEFHRSLQESDGIILDVHNKQVKLIPARAPEGGVLDLDSGDGVDRVCPAKSWSRDLVESELGHCSNGVFDRAIESARWR